MGWDLILKDFKICSNGKCQYITESLENVEKYREEKEPTHYPTVTRFGL